jgi:CspA family cold shock protein
VKKAFREVRNVSNGTPPSQSAGERFIGRVEWFSKRKGYGFIGWQEDEDVFVHRNAILGGGRKILQEGQRVEFGVRRTSQGPKAVNVIELPRGVDRDIDNPRHNPQISKGQEHRVKRRQRDSDSTETQMEAFVYSYTIWSR